jgi:hypothetical protein
MVTLIHQAQNRSPVYQTRLATQIDIKHQNKVHFILVATKIKRYLFW